MLTYLQFYWKQCCWIPRKHVGIRLLVCPLKKETKHFFLNKPIKRQKCKTEVIFRKEGQERKRGIFTLLILGYKWHTYITTLLIKIFCQLIHKFFSPWWAYVIQTAKCKNTQICWDLCFSLHTTTGTLAWKSASTSINDSRGEKKIILNMLLKKTSLQILSTQTSLLFCLFLKVYSIKV